MPATPKLQFSAPSAGWLPVSLSVGVQTLKFDASDALSNPIEELCSSLLNLIMGRGAITDWFLEPGSYEFSFAPSGDRVAFEVFLVERWGDGPTFSEQRTLCLNWSGYTIDILASFLCSLKRLEHAGVVTEEEWSWPFPSELLRKIEASVLLRKHEGEEK